MRNILFTIFFGLYCGFGAFAQQSPQYLHFFTNPYLYNPAFAGYDKSPVIYATHRRQWMGIEEAPVTSNLSFHMPLGNKSPIAVGMDITNDVYGLINNSSFRATFAYMVPLSVEADHHIKFGISAGAGVNSLDLSAVDITNDNTLINAGSSNMYLDGRFGIQYHLQGLNVGFVLPQIFANPLTPSETTSAAQLGRFTKYIISASYRINMGAAGGLSFEPSVLYHVSDEAENRIDAIGILYIKEAVWVGGAYQQQSGIGALLGVQVKKLKIGYAYGMGGSEIANYGSGTHEVQVGFTLGKKREVLRRKPRLTRSSATDYEPVIDDKKAKELEKAEKKAEKDAQKVQEKQQTQPETPADTNQGVILIESDEPAPDKEDTFDAIGNRFDNPVQKSEPNSSTVPDSVKNNKLSQEFIDITDKEKIILTKSESDTKQTVPSQPTKEPAVRVTKQQKSTHPLEMQPNKYAVVGTFSQRPYAEKMAQKLAGDGFAAELGFNTEKGFYYVYVAASDNLDDLKKKMQQLQQKGNFTDAWILIVE